MSLIGIITPTTAATVDNAGTMPADAYQQFVGIPPTDPSSAISTTGASGTYSEATVTNVTSSLDSSITSLSYDRCHDTGHAGSHKLVPTILFPGFGQAKSQFSTTLKRRMASYVGNSGLAPLVVAVSSRGRSPASGTIDYARDTQDRFDCLDHAVAAVGSSNVYGSGQSAILIGYSTGCFDALLAACRCPDRVLAVILYYPNFDLGVDPADSYWTLQSSSVRTNLTSTIGDRATGSATALDPYVARNPIDAIARIVALPNAPHIWVLSDRTEAPTIGLPSPDRLVAALKVIPECAAKTHVHITQTGDSNRILHDEGADGAGSIYAERYYFPTVLANAQEWMMPRESPASGLRLLGWMKTRSITGSTNPYDDRTGFEIWTGANTSPKTDSAGGKLHACELTYLDAGRQFVLDPVTSQNGYAQVLRDSDTRSFVLTAGSKLNVNLNVSTTISAVSTLGFTHEFRSDVGVTGTSPVTAWADQIGALSFTSSGSTAPVTATDGDSKTLLRFSAASSQLMLLNSLIVDPTQDFTICMVVNKTNSTAQHFLGVSHHGTLAELSLKFTSGVDGAQLLSDSFVKLAETGAQLMSINAKHFLALMRKNGVLYQSIDGSAWSKATILAGTFTTTGTNTTTIGAGWANSGGAYWQYLTGDVYQLFTKQSATSEADLLSAYALMKSRWTF